MSASTTKYTDLITSEHQTAPKFMAMVSAICQAWADGMATALSIPQLLDIDVAIGEQLDMIGQWVGITRNVYPPLSGVYFAFDTIGVGFDQGVWYELFNPVTAVVTLPDEHYRVLLKARIINNHWNGSVSDIYTLMNAALSPIGVQIFIKDYANLNIEYGIISSGTIPSALIVAMLTSGMLDVRPAGVHVNYYVYQNSSGPLFGFDATNPFFAGFDQGSWATAIIN